MGGGSDGAGVYVSVMMAVVVIAEVTMTAVMEAEVMVVMAGVVVVL